jgi:hypothetical protein
MVAGREEIPAEEEDLLPCPEKKCGALPAWAEGHLMEVAGEVQGAEQETDVKLFKQHDNDDKNTTGNR